MIEWIRESNLIEGIDRPEEDQRSELAWKWFIAQPLTIPNILKLHKRITWKQLGDEAGRFRTCQVWVGGREGARWEKVPELMAQWINNARWVSTLDDQPEDLFIKCHVEFEQIHPFIDGNGRTGRMILNWQRVKAGLDPLLIKSEERGDYYEWFYT